MHGGGDDTLHSTNGSQNGSGKGADHLTISGSADDVVSGTVAELGGLDIVVNCADLRVAGPFEELSDVAWDQLLTVNLTGPIRLFRAIRPIRPR